MKYQHKFSADELERVFGGLIELEHDYDKEVFNILRGSQTTGVVHVYLKTMDHALLLFDYLSTDRSKWDYEPKVCIHFPCGATIDFQRRGNYEHQLEKGDSLIVCDRVLSALKSGLIAGQRNTKQEYIKQIDSLNEIVQSQQKMLKELREKQTTVVVSNKEKDLPF